MEVVVTRWSPNWLGSVLWQRGGKDVVTHLYPPLEGEGTTLQH